MTNAKTLPAKLTDRAAKALERDFWRHCERYSAEVEYDAEIAKAHALEASLIASDLEIVALKSGDAKQAQRWNRNFHDYGRKAA